MADYLPDLTCIVRRDAPRRSWLASLKGEPEIGESTVICGRATVEQYLRCGYVFDWPATDAARRAALTPSPLPATQEDAERSVVGRGDEAFCSAVWDALKGDHNDLRRQQIILNAHRKALSTPQRQEYDGEAVREALAGLLKWADNIMRAHSITAPQKAVERARRALSATPTQTVIPETTDKTPRRDASPFPPTPAQEGPKLCSFCLNPLSFAEKTELEADADANRELPIANILRRKHKPSAEATLRQQVREAQQAEAAGRVREIDLQQRMLAYKALAKRAIERFAAQEANLGKEERLEVVELRDIFDGLANY